MAEIVKEQFERIQMEVNLKSDKSAAMVASVGLPEEHPMTGYTVQGHGHSFVVLGAELSDDTTAFIRGKQQRHERFFESLKQLNVHAAVIFTILRICGNPRLMYLCSVMIPDDNMKRLVSWFDAMVIEVLNGSALLRNHVKKHHLPRVYDTSGAGFTKYEKCYADLYVQAQTAAIQGPAHTTPVALAQTNQSLVQRKGAEHSAAGSWLFWTDTINGLTSAEFVMALGIRLGIALESGSIRLPTTCNCGKQVEETTLIEHSLTCDTFTTYGHVPRHNLVVDALCRIARAYGISTTREPKYYTYDNEKRERPDITFSGAPPTATDATIVQTIGTVGANAKAAARAKRKKHEDAVKKIGHVFHPFVLEATGFTDESCVKMIDAIADGNSMPRWLRFEFTRDMMHATSIAMARGRATALRIAVQRCIHAQVHALEYVGSE